MSGVSGVGGLKALAKRVHALKDPTVRRELSRALAEDALFLINEGFRSQTSPYGDKWQAAARGGQTLSDTGILRRSITYQQVSESGFRIGTPVKYAAIHNFGGIIKPKTKKALRFQIGGRWVTRKSVTMPQRQFLPDGKRPMPAKWRQAFAETAREFFRNLLGA